MAEAVPFLDTNILLRHLLGDVPDQAQRATAYLSRIEAGELTVHSADSVVMETVFTLQRHYHVPKAQIRDWLVPIIMLPSIHLPHKRRLIEVFSLYVDKNVSFIDAYHAVLMRALGLDTIVSFDRRIERIPGIRRVEP
jgi:predicted nucleic acid-binding protein